jgi:hypothetical protein
MIRRISCRFGTQQPFQTTPVIPTKAKIASHYHFVIPAKAGIALHRRSALWRAKSFRAPAEPELLLFCLSTRTQERARTAKLARRA